ncbi:MAG: methylenetetrahydrofolate--tRNA-(uracil(54)-C(5))-methyltransferase (FADH(2)-oxidizing) TrmFO [Clostridia bacterium]|nr:methylenetetrahydrofolate--tRNA-(uracil(54)-C(5))-methyltransferase (FADH(2)-oxidizing) TrmFO [Clostridia bacterium]MDD4376320.1 methylenetetrahydrofolate--tRNA-(uracil(54)-C(5))-methyltransferase (FADH(2)-oxidizing) TrmFO [Clostridia bacterium]
MIVHVIGAGLAGCECSYILASNGIKVKLYEMKPHKKSLAHTSNNFAELVCSNSLKSNDITNACGLLKTEMKILGSLIIEAAEKTKVEAGNALAVNRDEFSEYITKKIKENKNIQVIYKEIQEISNIDKAEGDKIVIATGPLTSDTLSRDIKKILGEEELFFYDAAAPIISKDSLDMNKIYRMDRYGEIGKGDYLNTDMTEEEYHRFYNLLINAETAERKEFDKLTFFEGCMPIEELARRGEKTLVFGPMKPVGLGKDGRAYATLQLRAEDKEETMYNLVGFQTSLKFREQKKVFQNIPGLENAEFLRYGVMHRNTFINAPKLLKADFSLKSNENIFFAGQISGVEGYVESAASGLMIAYNILTKLKGKKVNWKEETMLGSLAKHVSTEVKNYQPMNANFGIIKPLEVNKKINDKKLKYEMYAKRSLEQMEVLKDEFKGVRS